MPRQRKCMQCRKGGPSISLFRFPPEPAIRKKWADFCNVNLDDLKRTHTLCSLHFSASSFKTQGVYATKRVLVYGAVPSVITESSENENSAVPLCAERAKNDDSGCWTKYRKRKHTEEKTVQRKNVCCLCGVVESNIHRFRFPKDPHDVQKWLDVFGWKQEDLKSWHRVCEAHFLPTDFHQNTERVFLKKGVVPSHVLPPDVNGLSASGENASCSSEPMPSECRSMEVDEEAPEPLPPVLMSVHRPSTSPCDTQVTTESAGRDNKTPAMKRFPRHVSEITTPQCAGCKRAKIILGVAKRDVLDLRIQNTALTRENHRLKNKLKTLEDTVNDLRSRNLLSEDATAV